MRGYNAPTWSAGYGGRRGPETVAPSDMRVSDGDRQQIADALSSHFADGRLDRSEFDERMSKAMAAKTRRDLDGLLADLPHIGTAVEVATRPRDRRSRSLLLLIGAFLFFAMASSWTWHSWAWHSWIWRPHLGFLTFLLIVALIVRRAGRWHRGYRY